MNPLFILSPVIILGIIFAAIETGRALGPDPCKAPVKRRRRD